MLGGAPEEVEVGPLEVLIVKGKGEDGAEIVIRSRQYILTRKLKLSHLTIISVSRIKMKRIRYLPR